MRLAALVIYLCISVFGATTASSETEIVEGKFSSKETISEFQVQHFREETITVHHNSGWEAEFELWGSVQSIGICRDDQTGLDDLLIFHCDFGNGPVCVEQIVTARDGSPFNVIERDTLFEGDYTPNEGEGCSWRRGLEALSVVANMVETWRPISGQNENGTFDLNEDNVAQIVPKEIPYSAFKELLSTAGQFGPLLMQREVLAENFKWKLQLIVGLQTCKAPGLLFAEDKEQGRVYSIYSITSGCSKAFNYPPEEAHLNGDILEADFCVSCDWFGEWGRFRWDLGTHKIQLAQIEE